MTTSHEETDDFAAAVRAARGWPPGAVDRLLLLAAAPAAEAGGP